MVRSLPAANAPVVALVPQQSRGCCACCLGFGLYPDLRDSKKKKKTIAPGTNNSD